MVVIVDLKLPPTNLGLMFVAKMTRGSSPLLCSLLFNVFAMASKALRHTVISLQRCVYNIFLVD